MGKTLFVLFLCAFLVSCFPIRIAPSIDDYKVTKGKSFKRSLSKRQMFVFEDPKETGHFYNYINTKYQLGDYDVYNDIPFKINGDQYFFAFYEIQVSDKIVNLFPAIFNVIANDLLNNEDDDIEYINGGDVARNEHWYIAIEVYSDLEKDCLRLNSLSREMVLKYLRALKKEYMSIHNYNEVIFKN